MAKQVNDDKAFWFCNNSGCIGKGAHNLKEFSESLRTVPTDSIEFHLRGNKNDFEAWLISVMQEPQLAEEIKTIKSRALKGEALKSTVAKFAKRVARSA